MTNVKLSPAARRLQLIARALLLLFAGFWLFFIIASRWAEGFSAEGLPSLFIRGGGIVVLTVVALCWPLIGGCLLLLAGLLLFSGLVPWASGPDMAVRLMLAAPPMILGGLFVAAALLARSRDSSRV